MDAVLERVLRRSLEIGDRSVVPEDLAGVRCLKAQCGFLVHLEGLEAASDVEELDLSDNAVEDLAPLRGLVRLTRLDLGINRVSDLSPLAGLRALQRLDLHDNHIFRVDSLAGLTGLVFLDLMQNVVTDLRPLASLTGLTELRLGGYTDNPIGSHTAEMYGNPYWENIRDLSPLSGLVALESLTVADHDVNTLDALRGLRKLRTLSLGGSTNAHGVEDLSAVVDLVALRHLNLFGNHVTDLAPLLAHPGMGVGAEVNLEGNPLGEKARRVQVRALRERGVRVLVTKQPRSGRRTTRRPG